MDYNFPREGEQIAQPKISYAIVFAPWSWVLGTGIYIDDIEAEYRNSAILLGGITLAVLVLVSGIGMLISRSILTQLGGEPNAAVEVMKNVAQGDLTAHLTSRHPGSLLHSLGGMVDSLREMVSQINEDANQLVSHAEEIAKASEGVANAAEQQADATYSMAASIEELTVSSTHISAVSKETSNDSITAVNLSGQGMVSVQKVTTAIQNISTTVSGAAQRIDALEDRAKQVSSIASVIKEIAGQTNLLALNAAIEAARAGEMGRGFAVVADEVRKLAERTSSATTEIETMIEGIREDTSKAVVAMKAALPEVQGGVALAESATEALQLIEGGAKRTMERVEEVASATSEQSAASTSIAQHVEHVAQMVEETSGTIRGTAKSALELEVIANSLKALIGRFKV